jgi:hypothetical protein
MLPTDSRPTFRVNREFYASILQRRSYMALNILVSFRDSLLAGEPVFFFLSGGGCKLSALSWPGGGGWMACSQATLSQRLLVPLSGRQSF